MSECNVSGSQPQQIVPPIVKNVSNSDCITYEIYKHKAAKHARQIVRVVEINQNYKSTRKRITAKRTRENNLSVKTASFHSHQFTHLGKK